MQSIPINTYNIDFTGMDIVAQRRVVLDGVEYRDGDVLPEGALAPRRARQLFEQRAILIRAKRGPQPAEPVSEIAGDAETEVTRENGYGVEHRGFGRWHVIGPDGGEISGPHTRAQIEHLMR